MSLHNTRWIHAIRTSFERLAARLEPRDADAVTRVDSHDDWARLERQRAHAHESARRQLHPALWPQP